MTASTLTKPRLMLVWSGAVNPVYRSFFTHLSQHFDLVVLSPRNWKHGSIVFEGDASHGSKVNSDYILQYVTFSHLFGWLGSSQYVLPAWPLLLLRYRPKILYWMDEPDRIATWAHIAWAKVQSLGRIKTYAYMLQNIASPSYYKRHHLWSWHASKFCLDGLIAATPDSAKVAQAKGFTKPLTVIPLYGDPELFRPPSMQERNQARLALGLDDNHFVLAYAGSLHPAKGLALLSRTLTHHPKMRLICASGDTWNENLGPAPHAHLGPLQSSDLLRLYHAADAVILPSEPQPSWHEQIGRILIEGGLAGCLMVGSDCGAIPSVVNDPELIFKAGDPDDLNRLLGTLPEKATVTRKRRQYEHLRSTYTDAAVAAATSAFLKSTALPSPIPHADASP